MDLPSQVRVKGRFVRTSMRSDMDQQSITVDHLIVAMASIQEALTNLRQKMGSQQSRQPIAQDEVSHDSLPPPPPPSGQTVPQVLPYLLHGQYKVVLSTTVHTIVPEDTHASMDRIEQRIRQLRVSDNSVVWEDLDCIPMASLLAKFRIPDIEKYMGVACPCIHLRLYSTMMRAHGLDESQMITMFPLSPSGTIQCWFASLESSRRRTWDDPTQEFLRQFSFNIVVDVSRKELETLRQRSNEFISSFISHWRGKIIEIVDRPLEKDQIQMILRSCNPGLLDMWSEYLLQTLDLQFQRYMMWRMTFRDD